MRPLLLLFALVIAVPLAAQVAPVQIDPGMTRAQVIERLGRPATERSSGGFTYLFFINGCERTCGMNDLVTLQGDSVVDAIFRASQREYTGRSTSPVQTRTPRANRGPLTVGTPRVADSVVLRITPSDANSPPPAQRPITELTNRTIVPGARPESAPTTRLPADQQRPVPTYAPTSTAPDPSDARVAAPAPAPQTGATINPPTIRADTSRNTAGTRPDTTRGERLPITRSDTVMNPRTPTVLVPRADSLGRPPASRPPVQPPPAQSPPAAPPSP